MDDANDDFYGLGQPYNWVLIQKIIGMKNGLKLNVINRGPKI